MTFVADTREHLIGAIPGTVGRFAATLAVGTAMTFPPVEASAWRLAQISGSAQGQFEVGGQGASGQTADGPTQLEPSGVQAMAATGAGQGVLTLMSRDELLSRMTPEKRAIYEQIIALRKRIGPVDFNIVEALREMREDGR